MSTNAQTAVVRPPAARWRALLALLLALVVAGCTATGDAGAHTAATPPTAAAVAAPPATPLPVETGSPTPTPAGQTPGGPTPTDTPTAQPPTPRPVAPSPTAPPQALTRRPSPTPGGVSGLQFTLHVPILMYHRIVPASLAGNSLPWLVISPALFDAQLSLLHDNGWHAVTVAQVAAALAARQPLPPRTFAISIDDGWADGYTYALPILEKYGYHATYYVPAGRVGVLVNFLSPPELRTLAADGMEIADHAWSGDQIVLTELSPAQVQYQIEAAANRLTAIVGSRPVTFSYPGGRYDQVAVNDLAADGFTMAVVEGGSAYETWANRFAVARVRVSPDTTPAGLLGVLRRLEPGS